MQHLKDIIFRCPPVFTVKMASRSRTSRSRTLLSYVTDSGSLTTTIEAEMSFVVIDPQLNQIFVLDTSTMEMKEFYVQFHIMDPTGRLVESSQRVQYQGRTVRLSLTTSKGGKQLVHTTWSDEHGTVRDVNSQTLTIPTCVCRYNKH